MSGQQQDDRADEAQANCQALREQAERCRRLASTLYTREASEALEEMAQNFDRSADNLTTKPERRRA